MKRTLTLLILLVALSACTTDPLGMTSREQARSDAQQAQWNSQALQAEAQARAAEAQANADVEKTQIEAWTDALQKVEDASKRNQGIVWLLILAVVGLSGTAIYWMGRTNTTLAQNASQHTTPPDADGRATNSTPRPTARATRSIRWSTLASGR